MRIPTISWGNRNRQSEKIFLSKQINHPIDSLSSHGNLTFGMLKSYGDCAINSSGVATSSMDRTEIHFLDDKQSVICGAGVLLSELEIECLKRGYFPYVVPGTSLITIGGAVASDIHGKSHHVRGSFGNYVVSIKLRLSNNSVIELSREANKEIFLATIGGMGLTGEILEVEILLNKIYGDYLDVTNLKVPNLQQAIAQLEKLDQICEYSVAWLDLSGDYEGRGIVSGANHSHLKRSKKIELRKSISIPEAISFPNFVISRLSIRIFNELWFRKRHNSGLQKIINFMHPLDAINNWNKIYGRAGMIQYQFAIPDHNRNTLFEIVQELKKEKFYSAMAVLKSFGEFSEGMLSFPLKGWTLAIDFPAKYKNLNKVLAKFDEMVIRAGGRVYLAKDARLDEFTFKAMYPNSAKWKSVKMSVDPENYWQSDQGRRIGLC